MMKHKILQIAIVENLVCFLDEIQEEALMDSTLPENKEKIRFCGWAIKKLLDAKDAIITIHEDKENKNIEKIVDRYEKIDEKFYDWKLPSDMSEKDFDKMLDQFDAFLRGWEKEYNKKHPKKPAPKRKQKFKPPHIEDVAQYMSLDEIKEYLIDDPELTNEERFDLYYEEHKRIEWDKEQKRLARGAKPLDQIMEELGILPYEPKNKKKKKK
jgi:hypothetical protein